MFKFFKKQIPTDNTQEVTIMQSWTVQWGVKSGRLDDYNFYSKVFIKLDEAKEFEKQLKQSAKFINAPIITELYEN